MARSRKKHPVCSSHDSLKVYKQDYNRRFRRKMKQGLLDDYSLTKGNLNRKLENFSWIADSYKFYTTLEQWNELYTKNEKDYQDYMRWYIRK